MGKVVTLGEIMLRLSTEQGTRIDSSERFAAHYRYETGIIWWSKTRYLLYGNW